MCIVNINFHLKSILLTVTSVSLKLFGRKLVLILKHPVTQFLLWLVHLENMSMQFWISPEPIWALLMIFKMVSPKVKSLEIIYWLLLFSPIYVPKQEHFLWHSSAVDRLSNPGVLVIIDSLSLFLSSFLNQKIPGVLWYPSIPAIYTAVHSSLLVYRASK